MNNECLACTRRSRNVYRDFNFSTLTPDIDIAVPFVCPSVCLSVCPSRSGIVLKRLNISSQCLHLRVAQSF